MKTEQRLLTVHEVALAFRRSDQTIRGWIADGKLAAHKIQSRLLIEESEVARLMEEAPE